jgi:hypothetical protein
MLMEDLKLRFLTEQRSKYKSLLSECLGSYSEETLYEGYDLLDRLYDEFKALDGGDCVALDDKYINKLRNLLKSSYEKIDCFVRCFTEDLMDDGLEDICDQLEKQLQTT